MNQTNTDNLKLDWTKHNGSTRIDYLVIQIVALCQWIMYIGIVRIDSRTRAVLKRGIRNYFTVMTLCSINRLHTTPAVTVHRLLIHQYRKLINQSEFNEWIRLEWAK